MHAGNRRFEPDRQLGIPFTGPQSLPQRRVDESVAADVHPIAGSAEQMIHHPLTDTGILQFRRDWEAVQTASRKRAPAGRNERTSIDKVKNHVAAHRPAV